MAATTEENAQTADSFEQVTTLERLSEHEHRLIVPDGWQQGRGAFGGLVLGILMRAMNERESDGARLARSFSGDICGPLLPKETRVLTRILRRGNNQTNLAATLEQDGAVSAHGTCVLAAPRRIRELPAMTLQPPDHVDFATAKMLPIGPPAGPVFARHFEYRPTGILPFSGGGEPVVQGFVKERVPLSKVTAAALLARLDSYWPALFSVESRPRMAATVSFLAEFLCDPSTLDPQLPLFYRARAVAQAGGYFVEFRELWHEQTLLALNQQTFAVLD